MQLSLQRVEDELQVQRAEQASYRAAIGEVIREIYGRSMGCACATQARLQRCMASFEALEASGTRVEAMQRAQRARELVVHRLVLEQKRAALQASEAMDDGKVPS